MNTKSKGIRPMILMAGFSLFSFTGTRPSDLGINGGKLKPCPGSPNCVCSQASDEGHATEPLKYEGTRDEGMANLKSILSAVGKATIIDSKPDYVYTEFKSTLFGFVDDVEFYFDPQSSLIHVRSASRLGYGDFGANRKRLESIRAQLSKPKT